MNQFIVTITYSLTWTKVFIEDRSSGKPEVVCSYIRDRISNINFNSVYDSTTQNYLFQNKCKEKILTNILDELVKKRCKFKNNQVSKSITYKYKNLEDFIENARK